MDILYEKFAAVLLGAKVYIDRSVTFRQICSWIGTAPGPLDRMLSEELGMCGDAILSELRRQYAENLIFVLRSPAGLDLPDRNQ